MKHLKEIVIKQIAPQLRDLRLERKLKLSEIANQTDLSVDTIDNMEQGRNSAYDKYHKLIRFYGKSLKISLD